MLSITLEDPGMMEEPADEPVGALHLALGLGRTRPAQPDPQAEVALELQDPRVLPPRAAGDRHDRGHVVREDLARHPAEAPKALDQAPEEVLLALAEGEDEQVEPRVAQGRREDVEFDLLAAFQGHPQPLLPVDLELLPGAGLEPRVGLPAVPPVFGDAVRFDVGFQALVGPAEAVFLGPEPGEKGPDRHAGDPHLPLDVGPPSAVLARLRGPLLVEFPSLLPVLPHRVPVLPVFLRQLREVRLHAFLLDHCQFGQDVDFSVSHSDASIFRCQHPPWWDNFHHFW
jgi:hypothetical protein